MLLSLGRRFLTETDLRLLWKFAYNFGWKGMRAVKRFEKRKKKGGDSFPAFMVISITDKCNLRCQGCWVTPCNPPRELSLEQLDNIVRECKLKGSFFFGILGGEPLLHPQLFELISRHPDAYFQVFTNGTKISDGTAAEMRRLGNVTPLISVEGNERVSDERRGGNDVYQQAMSGLDLCRKHRLITGVATSVCNSNIDDLVSEKFIRELIERGVHYLWYYIYRPAGSDPSPELALSAEEILRLRRFIVEMRSKMSMIIVDAYWDHQGNALCPAAMGISHHIGPAGDVEFCPPIQFSVDNIADGSNLAELVGNSEFINRFRDFSTGSTRGCVLLESPGAMREFLETENAVDSSGRGTAYQELTAMKSCAGHHQPGQEIPEKHWVYRVAKKYWFFGFGAYG